MQTTNYYNTFISISDDCKAVGGEIPQLKTEKTVANLLFDMIVDDPYRYTSDEVIFNVFAQKKGIKKSDQAEAKTTFFSKGQPCLRACPLVKRYGWGVHFDPEGKIALYAVDSPEYIKFSRQQSLKQLKGMKSSR